MILLLGGTSEGREVAQALAGAGHAVQLTTVTEYAGQLAAGIDVHVGALDKDALTKFVRQARVVVDATHPFATVISQMAITACAEQQAPYVRFERAESALPAHVQLAENAEHAAHLAVEQAQGGTIFLTVGSKSLATYLTVARPAGCRVIARVLPTASVLTSCEALGLQPRDIIAMQGPVTSELEIALLKHYQARVLVTKESGPTGGVEEKINAAEAVGIPVIVVSRPAIAYPRVVHTVADVLACCAEECGCHS